MVGVGAKLSLQPLKIKNQSQSQEIEAIHVIVFIICGSGMLVLLYFLYTYLDTVLTIMISLSCLGAIQLMLDELCFSRLSIKICRKQCNIWLVGPVNLDELVSFLIAAAIIAIYLITKNFMVNNVLALFITLALFKIIRLPSYKIALILLGLAFCYDVFWVFYSNVFFGRSVMSVVAQKVDLPMKFECPKFQRSPLPYCALIGVGDLVLPGLFVAFCYRMDKILKTSNIYYRISLAGYGIGLATCVFFLFYYQTAQPALLYLVPFTLIPIAVAAHTQGHLAAMWYGKKIGGQELTQIHENKGIELKQSDLDI